MAYRERLDLMAVSRFSPGLFPEGLVHPWPMACCTTPDIHFVGIRWGGEDAVCGLLGQLIGGRLLWATDLSSYPAAAFAQAGAYR